MNKIFLIIMFSCLLSCLTTKPVFAITDTLGNYFYQKAETFLTAAEYDSAIFYYEKANEIFYKEESWERYVESLNHLIFGLRENDNLDSSMVIAEYTLKFADSTLGKQNIKYAQTLNELGRNYDRAGEYDKAMNLADQSYNILKTFPESIELSENYSLRGSVKYEIGEYDSASINYLKAIEIKKSLLGEDHISLLSDYNGISLVLTNKGDYEKAIEYLYKCLGVVHKTFGEEYRDISTLYNNIAINYFYGGDNDLAMEYYQKAIYIDNEYLEPTHFNFGLRYNNIAMALRINKDFEQAIYYEKKAIDIFRINLGEDHPNYASAINNLGRIYFDKEEYDNAHESYQTALSILKNKYGNDHPTVAQTLYNVAEVFLKKNDYLSGLDYSRRSLGIRLNLFGEKHPKVSETYRLIGDLQLDNNEPDSALYYYQKAIIVLADDFSLEDPKMNPDIKNISPQRNFLPLLSRKARAFYLKHENNSGIEDLTTSYETYLLCNDAILKLRRSYKTESARLAVEEASFSIYENGINVFLRLYNISQDKSYLEKAFEFAERSKAGILLDALYESEAKKFSGIPDSLIEKERQIKVDLSYYDTQIHKEKERGNEVDSVKLKHFEESLFSENRKYDELLNFYSKTYPEYFSVKYKDKLTSVYDIQKSLIGDDEVFLEYFMGDSLTTIFTITKDNLFVESVSSKIISDNIRQFRKSLASLDFESYQNSAFELYSLLIKPIEHNLSGIRKLYIISDGILNYLPFEALLTASFKNSNPDFSKLSYLVNKYEMSYFFSAATLLETKNKSGNAGNGFAGFAPVFTDDEMTKNKIASVIDTSSVMSKRAAEIEGKIYSSLPETEKEVNEIFGLYNSANIPAQLFLHESAKEKVIKSGDAENFNVIHLASHGFINESKPKLSGILFWIDEESENEDGILYSNEIYNLNLNADLLVLSACETGLGKIVKGEGLIGLTRGFLYSGVKNIIVSLWQVADKSTSELMIEFYKNVLAGKNYSSALREAKLKLIKNGTFSYPLEWSPFVLIGN